MSIRCFNRLRKSNTKQHFEVIIDLYKNEIQNKKTKNSIINLVKNIKWWRIPYPVYEF